MNKNDAEIIDSLIKAVDQLLEGNVNNKNLQESDIATSIYPEVNILVDKLFQLKKQYSDGFQYIMKLSNGNLEVEAPRHNTIAAHYKKFQSELLHLKWLINEVAGGNYDQEFSFSGDLSIAFNKMVSALREKQILEEQLKEKTEQLKVLNSTKDRLLSIIAHDLKNPFNALIGYSRLLMETVQSHQYQPEELELMTSIMYQSATQGYDLLVNLLEWSRQQSSGITVTPQIVDLKNLIRQNQATALLTAAPKNITIEIPDTIEYQVYTDKDILNTILRNLISNAIKYTPEGGKISIHLAKEISHYIVSIQDTGVGIAEEDIHKLFRVDTIHSTKGTNSESGTGLGLILCYELIQLIQGKIWVESEVNIGSTFSFTLPDLQ